MPITPQVLTTDSEGIFHVRISKKTTNLRVYIEAAGFEAYNRTAPPSRTGLEDIQLKSAPPPPVSVTGTSKPPAEKAPADNPPPQPTTKEVPLIVTADWNGGTNQEIVLPVPGQPHNITITVNNRGEALTGTCPTSVPQPPTPANYVQRQCEPAHFHDMTVEYVTVTSSGSQYNVVVRIANGAEAPGRTIKLSATLTVPN